MKIAIVTGASSGLGREFVKELAAGKKFEEIWVIARRREEMLSLGQRGICLRVLPLDLTEEESFTEISGLLEREKPEVGLLINNAGFGHVISFAEERAEEILSMMRLNNEAPLKLIKLCLPHMKRGSAIINVCSVAGFLPLPKLAVYSASKSFLLRFSRALARELKPGGITVTALCPYWITDTGFISKAEGPKNPFGALKAKDVAKSALSAARKGDALCIPGFMGKLTYLGGRFLPLSILLSFQKVFRA
ncbi:SDR family NAD(P)-dependent oxidoreductase [Dialister sp.]|uniref:SDR family NAD(P)-dependent oxidoreductase n=1 Tax=Dialister sp. TaxID=1955814 RepID=UPI002E81DC3F|nr:SDR family NAD(P)-dependent oxidoreductase [Dialister sp.]MEE3453003.1 SDR family NAD(P)-dependent oxidoreductase [Dialister sp.]